MGIAGLESGIVEKKDLVRRSSVYKNGIWTYQKSGVYNQTLAPLIRGNDFSLISYVQLLENDDRIYMGDRAKELTSMDSYFPFQNSVTLEYEKGRVIFLGMILRDIGSNMKYHLEEEINKIGDLELTLKRELGDYRKNK